MPALFPTESLSQRWQNPRGLQSNSAEPGGRWSPCWSQMSLASLGSWDQGWPRQAHLTPWNVLVWNGSESLHYDDHRARAERDKAPGCKQAERLIIFFISDTQLSSVETHGVPIRLPYSLQNTVCICHGVLQSPSCAKHYGNMRFASPASSMPNSLMSQSWEKYQIYILAHPGTQFYLSPNKIMPERVLWEIRAGKSLLSWQIILMIANMDWRPQAKCFACTISINPKKALHGLIPFLLPISRQWGIERWSNLSTVISW